MPGEETMCALATAMEAQGVGSALGPLGHKLDATGPVRHNLTPAALVEAALARGEGILTDTGALAAFTGAITGRSPKDRYLIAEPGRADDIWWGPINQPMEPDRGDRLFDRVRAYLQGRELFVADAVACADDRYQLPVRVIADKAWHTLFAQCLLRPCSADRGPVTTDHDHHAQNGFPPPSPSSSPSERLTIVCASGMKADPVTDGTRSEVFVVLNLARRLVLIGGTEYAGEIKKSVFSFLNYLLPGQGVFPMHCSANIGPAGDTALFFGLSGTGKTTLSADPERRLIGDDEHAWSDTGVFNIEGGCYAKCIRLTRAGEPQIWDAIRFGAVLENVVVDPVTRRPNFDDARLTENTRVAYPVDFVANAELGGRGGHPSHVLFLTCDAFGVLPPLARLSSDQALYHFLSGYTAKVAGTETGVTEPEATFSTCFAAPFLPLHPARYAGQLRERLAARGSKVWLVNTGWTAGPDGVGRRMQLGHTRAMVRAILAGQLDPVPAVPDPNFGVVVPRVVPGVPPELLQPRATWPDPAAYDRQARRLAELFKRNFEQYAGHVDEPIRRAGPV
jgi:phosphoenolpyruvate carboxykinase (ATP)